jgi:hypothetical protein
MKTNIHFWSYLAQFFPEWEIFQKKFVEKIKTHILCPTTFSKIMPFVRYCENTVQPDRAQMKIWHMCIACWMSKATNTHAKYVIFIAFTLQQWLDERDSMLCYTYVALLLDGGVWSASHPSCFTNGKRLISSLLGNRTMIPQLPNL